VRKQGDDVADAEFSAYVAARRDAVRRTAYLLCGDWHQADDLTQTAFVKLHGAWHRIRDRGALDAYVRSTLVRATVDESRRPWRREKAVDAVPDQPALSGTGSAVDIAELVANRELVRGALASVPTGQRAVLVMRYFEGLDVAATARALNCSEGNVKSQTARGLAALRAALAVRGEVGEGVR
jgi:RNA polymerase sigma-70 factor (sigma-E family)